MRTLFLIYSYFGGWDSRALFLEESAVVSTFLDGSTMLRRLKDLATGTVKEDLDSIFQPLHDVSAFKHPRFRTDHKAYGLETKWVRIYAVRCDKNVYVITGFGIKLVRKLQEDPLLVIELTKLQKATDFLKNQGFL